MLSGKGRLAGVMGWPVKQSRSPRLHGFWLQRYDIDGAYVPLAVRPENFEDALKSLKILGFQGVNVTVPHKEAALACVDILSKRAERIGAVNTIVVQEDGKLFGDNTDGYGFYENLIAGCPTFCADSGPAVVLGAGGAARAIIATLLDHGCTDLRITNRTFERAKDLAKEFGTHCHAVKWEKRSAALDGIGLLVNTTTQGMEGYPPLDLDLTALPKEALVNDIVYTPLMTPLLAEAKDRGNPIVDGLGMLLHQARPGFWRWFGRDPAVDDALRAHVLKDL